MTVASVGGDKAPILAMRGISKSFKGVKALDDVSLTLRAGEVHALMGENGAGKSTLIKVLTGVYSSDGGEIRLEGNLISPRSSLDAQKLGIGAVYQEVNLVPQLSVAENIFLGREPKRWGRIDWAAVYAGAEKALARLDLHLDVRRPLEDYSIAVQQMTAIARALDQESKVIVFDEATSSLDVSEVEQLFKVIRSLQKQGIAVLFVSHFLDQIYAISDRMTVFRNGRYIGEYKTADLPRFELIAKMTGQENAVDRKSEDKQARQEVGGDAWFECEGLGDDAVGPIDLKVRKGETVGLAGLLGSGRTETARMIFGLDEARQGRLKLDGKTFVFKNPRQAIRQGLALLPEDRKSQAIFPELSLRENIILALQARRGWFRLLSRKKQDEIADHYIRALRIRARDAEQPIETLSGGNQQKAILARWLVNEPRLLILDEPTRGVDVGAKAEIQNYMNEFAAQGRSVVFISSELEEVEKSCHRAIVLKDRRKIGELSGLRLKVDSIMRMIAGSPT